MNTNAPVGIFDSGFGGLTVARAIVDLLPGEDLIYLGDTARAPYGPRPIAEVRTFALACLDALVDMGVKALVIACNSASAAVLADARERYSIPVVEVVLPAAKRAVRVSRTGKLAVLSTQATATSRAYEDAVSATDAELTTIVCPRFVDFVEAGITSGEELMGVAKDYLSPIIDTDVDTVILGCTHYPLLAGVISYVLGDQVTLVSSAEECATATYGTLANEGLLREGDQGVRRFLTTGNPQRFTKIASRLLGDFVNTTEAFEEVIVDPAHTHPRLPARSRRVQGNGKGVTAG
ncbi:MAG: glutamate racemase [Propionibacteriaceae bacterium]|nr:glutamate racemase [Propionibacteriaceae bacterium]